MQINDVDILDTFAEAFPMTATRVIITAADAYWARRAAESMTGFATSVIGCGCEAGIESEIPADQSPDGRPGVTVLLFSISGKELEKQLTRRISQCVLTCPSTSAFAGMTGEKLISMGDHVRYFGDGYQQSKRIGERRIWRVPVMDGEFVCEDKTARQPAVGGGNFVVLSQSLQGALTACQAAQQAVQRLPRVIIPFPGGVARSGSKVGSKYRGLSASTNVAFCPTLRHVAPTLLPDSVTAALEVVIDGLTESDVVAAMQVGIRAACAEGRKHGLQAITAGNYGGKLGKYHFHLYEVLQ
ncbi:MAG: formylmethanofuran--tetrahydromethanopterin N-formyltransferase [Pirellulaceae bacterium]|nr:formylmethanofuran--tetrahydromethanopterin N-formyltransferase [Pirellulaceae bacterium]